MYLLIDEDKCNIKLTLYEVLKGIFLLYPNRIIEKIKISRRLRLQGFNYYIRHTMLLDEWLDVLNYFDDTDLNLYNWVFSDSYLLTFRKSEDYIFYYNASHRLAVMVFKSNEELIQFQMAWK